MAQYTFQKQVDPEQLHKELIGLPGFDGLSVNISQVTCLFTAELSNENQIILGQLIDAHNYAMSPSVIRRKVRKAVNGAQDIIEDFATENILMGITQAGKTKLIADTMSSVMYYCQTGSLYEVLTALNAVVITEDMAPFLTNARRDEYVAKFTTLINSL